MLIKSIANNCPKVKELFTFLAPEDFNYVELLLLKCRFLEAIWFRSNLVSYANENNIGDVLLNILTKFSPNSLTKIYISSGWEYSLDALNRFFESFRERTLQQF